MHVLVNGVRLFFDVEGARLVPDGPAMREHADAAAAASWIESPIVLGASFGGMVALADATRKPSTPPARNRSTHLATVFGVVLTDSPPLADSQDHRNKTGARGRRRQDLRKAIAL